MPNDSFTEIDANDAIVLAETTIKRIRRSRRRLYRKMIKEHRVSYFFRRQRTIKEAVTAVKSDPYWREEIKVLASKQEYVCKNIITLAKYSQSPTINISTGDLYLITP